MREVLDTLIRAADPIPREGGTTGRISVAVGEVAIESKVLSLDASLPPAFLLPAPMQPIETAFPAPNAEQRKDSSLAHLTREAGGASDSDQPKEESSEAASSRGGTSAGESEGTWDGEGKVLDFHGFMRAMLDERHGVGGVSPPPLVPHP